MKHHILRPDLLPIDHRRDMLEAHRVSSDGGEVAIPEPLSRLRITCHAAGSASPDELLLFLPRNAGELFREAGTNDKDVARAQLDTLFFSDGFDVLHGDLVALKRTVLDTLLLGPQSVIDEYAAGNKATSSVPMIERREFVVQVLVAERLCEFFHIGSSLREERPRQCVPFIQSSCSIAHVHSIVARLRGLVVEVDQRIPLTGTLRVELYLVVVAMQP